MTPLAQRMLRFPSKGRDTSRILNLIGKEMHCFEVSAIIKSVTDAMDEENMWPEVASMLPTAFLPSPVTWLEWLDEKGERIAVVLRKDGDWFVADLASTDKDGFFTMGFCSFRARGPLESGERIEVKDIDPNRENLMAGWNSKNAALPMPDLYKLIRPNEATETYAKLMPSKQWELLTRLELAKGHISAERAGLEVQINTLAAKADLLAMSKTIVVASVLLIDLINTPGLIGLKQHPPHKGLARALQGGVGSFPLRGWSEVVVKSTMRVYDGPIREGGPAFHKCLHFVRSHARHYQDGHVTIIPAHWRGDAALGIKRTRYKVTA